jgi:hypothetical protein
MLAVSALVFHFVKSLRMALIVHAFQRVQNPSRISKADKLATSATLLLLLSNPAYLDILICCFLLRPLQNHNYHANKRCKRLPRSKTRSTHIPISET